MKRKKRNHKQKKKHQKHRTRQRNQRMKRKKKKQSKKELTKTWQDFYLYVQQRDLNKLHHSLHSVINCLNFLCLHSLIYSNHGNIFNSFCHVSIQICDGVYKSTNIPRVLCACQTLLILLIWCYLLLYCLPLIKNAWSYVIFSSWFYRKWELYELLGDFILIIFF